MENKQTAVEWFVTQLENHYLKGDIKNTTVYIQAKEMERKQIEEAYYKGSDDWEFIYRGLNDYAGASDYFNKTYKNGKEI